MYNDVDQEDWVSSAMYLKIRKINSEYNFKYIYIILKWIIIHYFCETWPYFKLYLNSLHHNNWRRNKIRKISKDIVYPLAFFQLILP